MTGVKPEAIEMPATDETADNTRMAILTPSAMSKTPRRTADTTDNTLLAAATAIMPTLTASMAPKRYFRAVPSVVTPDADSPTALPNIPRTERTVINTS